MGEFDFAGQYQQRPVPLEGGIVKRHWLHYYNEIPNGLWQIIISWDTAAKAGSKNAYSACSVLGICDTKDATGIHCTVALLEVHRMKLEFPDLVETIKNQSQEIQQKYKTKLDKKYIAIETVIEDASSGTALIQFLNSKGIIVEGVKPEADKETRLTAITHLIQNGTVLLPNQQDSDMVDFLDELLKFPNSVFKDMVDSFSQGVRYADDKYISGRRGYF